MPIRNLVLWEWNAWKWSLQTDLFQGVLWNIVNSDSGSQGVGVGARHKGVIAWKAIGSELHSDFGARIIAIWLVLKDIGNKDVSVFLLSAYAPVTNAPDNVWNEYLEKLIICIKQKCKSDTFMVLILVWGLLLYTVMAP